MKTGIRRLLPQGRTPINQRRRTHNGDPNPTKGEAQHLQPNRNKLEIC
uniref:Uncharacterized protein n=1 Tax=Arundo donax TaxID=35708 RepID=A0A0A8XQM5_ARUDO